MLEKGGVWVLKNLDKNLFSRRCRGVSQFVSTSFEIKLCEAEPRQ